MIFFYFPDFFELTYQIVHHPYQSSAGNDNLRDISAFLSKCDSVSGSGIDLNLSILNKMWFKKISYEFLHFEHSNHALNSHPAAEDPFKMSTSRISHAKVRSRETKLSFNELHINE